MPKLHRSSALDEAGVPTYGDGEPALFQCQAAAGGGGFPPRSATRPIARSIRSRTGVWAATRFSAVVTLPRV